MYLLTLESGVTSIALFYRLAIGHVLTLPNICMYMSPICILEKGTILSTV